MSILDKVNITLGFISNYCTIKYTQYNSSLVSNFTEVYDASFITLNDNSGWVYWNDIGLMAAVNKVNRDASVLPGVHVNLKRFTDCGPWDPAAAQNYAGKSGGYASAVTAMDIAEVYTDVIGVIGNEYSSVTKETAEILSHYQIPYCSLISGSPSLSNKHKYPYLWRTLPISFARSFGLILSEWKVKRVGIIYQKDDLLSSAMFQQCISLFQVFDMTVVTSIGLIGKFDSDSIRYVAETITHTDSR
ncbi:periplasmic binding protein-like I [Chytriomyces sp. MP71]|nr:periplasmic binding protein-like I [Chytriomyces sp. MP71]